MIYVIGIGPGNSLDYLTMRAYKVLKSANVGIYVGEMIGKDIKDLFNNNLLHTGRHLSIEEVKWLIIQYHQQNKSMALMMPGDLSFYSGQYNEQFCVGEYVQWFKENHFEFELIPGISSLSASVAKLQLDLTDFSGNQNVLITSIERLKDLQKFDSIKFHLIFGSQSNLIFFQSYKEWEWLKKTIKDYYSSQSRVIFIYKISWNDEQIIDTNIENVDIDLNGKEISKHTLIIVIPKI